jgi:hypothetical protein
MRITAICGAGQIFLWDSDYRIDIIF